MSNPVVLIISANTEFHSSLRQRLNEMGCHALCVSNEKRGLNWAEEFRPEVVLISQPAEEGDLRETRSSIIRSFPDQFPIFLLMPEPSDLLPGVAANAGSDGTVDLESMADVVGKLASLRHHRLDGQRRISYRGLEMDRQRHRATIEGRDLKLTVTEFQLLWTMTQRPGHVLTREQLFDSCQRGRNGSQLRTVDAHIKSIRRKLREHSNLIQTVRGVGYCLQSDADDDARDWSAPGNGAASDRFPRNSFSDPREVRRA